MKSLVLFTMLLLPTVAAFSQSSFHPLGTGDSWIYWEYGQYGEVWDTVTVRVEGDTSLSGRLYKIRHQWLSRYHTDYVLSPERVDSSGNVFRWNSKMGGETLAYRFGDTAQSGWFSEGSWLRFDSCAVEDRFGRARRVLYIGEYSTVDTTLLAQRLFIDSIGYYTTIFYGIVDGAPPAVLHEARIKGVYYGPSPEVRLAGDFYPLEVGNRWNYHIVNTDGYAFRDSNNVEITVVGDTLMPNGHVYAQLSQPDVLEATFVRSDSSWVYYCSPYDGTDVPMYNLHAPAGTQDPVHWGGVSSSYLFSVTEDSLLGVRRVSRTYSLGGLVFYEVTLTDGIGITRAVNMRDGGPVYTWWTLRGAVIRDTIYGVPVHVPEKGSLPSTYTLFQNYPNPFNPSTRIRYALPERTKATMTVFNALGQQVATLVDREVEAGFHEVTFDASGLATGVYFYRLQAEDFIQTRKLCVVR